MSIYNCKCSRKNSSTTSNDGKGMMAVVIALISVTTGTTQPPGNSGDRFPQRPRWWSPREANRFIRGFHPRPIAHLVPKSVQGNQGRSSYLQQPRRRFSPEGVQLTWWDLKENLRPPTPYTHFFINALACPSSKRISRVGFLAGTHDSAAVYLAENHSVLCAFTLCTNSISKRSFQRNLIDVLKTNLLYIFICAQSIIHLSIYFSRLHNCAFIIRYYSYEMYVNLLFALLDIRSVL